MTSCDPLVETEQKASNVGDIKSCLSCHLSVPFECFKPIPDYKCAKCKYQTDLIIELKKHQCYKPPPNKSQVYYCTKCTFKTYSLVVLTRHDSECVVNLSNINISNTNYETFFSCRQFLFLVVRDMSIEWLKCQHCNYMRQIHGNLKHHLAAIHPDKNVKWLNCESCLFNVEQVFLLKQHILEEHAEENIATC